MNILMQIISIVVVLSGLVLLVWRIIPNAGIDLTHRIDKSIAANNHVPSNKECAAIFTYTLLFRVFIIVAGFVIYGLFIEKGNAIQFNQIAEIWNKWDAAHYMRIAQGYTSYAEKGEYITLVFFPLYSWLLRCVSIFIPHTLSAGLVTSTLCSGVACVFLYKLVCIDYSKRTAQKAVILMCVFPFAFFYSAIMSESAFIMMSVMTLYYVRKHNWIAAGIAGMLCALSRSVGVFLIFPATVEFVEQYQLLRNWKNIKQNLLLIVKKWSWLLLLPIGTCIYLFINYKITGNALYFLKLEEQNWHQVGQPFFKTVGDLWGNIMGGYSLELKMSTFIPGFIILIFVYGVMLYAIPRHRSMYSAWLWIYVIVNTTMSWPLSLCRYLAAAIPVYIILGDVCDKNRKIYAACVIGFSILFGVYLTAYLMGSSVM